ncbi:tyrosine-type recombinase/integrase [Streptomyces aquilus]|uniref:tyrosine-type recombinase/integrase n=1 Tax=Streptomyces aquilus TaxID=2548456 RepID=UPI0037CD753D
MATTGWIEDRWLKKRKDPITGKRERTKLWGTNTKRYRVCGIPGVRKRSFHTSEEAKSWMNTTITAMKKKEFVDDRDGEILLGNYITDEWWPSREYDENTAAPMKSKIFNHIVNSTLGRTQMVLIGDEQLLAWKRELKARGLQDSTIGVIWNHLSSIFKTAVGKRIAQNPCRAADNNVRPKDTGDSKARAWAADEAAAIRKGVRRRFQIVADLGMHSGQRQGETFAFSPDDVDRERKVIHVRRQLLRGAHSRPYFKLPKGRKERTVPLSDGLLRLIDAHVSEFPPVTVTLPWQGPGNDNKPTATVRLMVTTRFGNPINYSDYNDRVMKPALAAAGLIAERGAGADGSGWEASREMMHHRWRHTYASVQLAAGEDPVAVALWLGHESPAITFKIYAHFIPNRGDRGRTAVDAWLTRVAAAQESQPLEIVSPVAWREVLPLALPSPAPAELFVQGARYAGAWVVGVLLDKDGSLIGEVRTDPTDDPDQALAAALAWVRECCALESLTVEKAENLNGKLPVEARPFQALGRFSLHPDAALV